jgi:hypothetical protein
VAPNGHQSSALRGAREFLNPTSEELRRNCPRWEIRREIVPVLVLLSRIHVRSSACLSFSPGGAAVSSPGRKPRDRSGAPTSEPRRGDRAGGKASVAPSGLGDVSPRPPGTRGSRPGLLTAAPPGLKPLGNTGLASNKHSRIRDSRIRKGFVGATGSVFLEPVRGVAGLETHGVRGRNPWHPATCPAASRPPPPRPSPSRSEVTLVQSNNDEHPQP